MRFFSWLLSIIKFLDLIKESCSLRQPNPHWKQTMVYYTCTLHEHPVGLTLSKLRICLYLLLTSVFYQSVQKSISLRSLSITLGPISGSCDELQALKKDPSAFQTLAIDNTVGISELRGTSYSKKDTHRHGFICSLRHHFGQGKQMIIELSVL